MPVWLLDIVKWVIVTFIYPMIKSAYENYKKVKDYTRKADTNIKKAEDYEANKPDSSPDSLP